jgi:hypothetical protein
MRVRICYTDRSPIIVASRTYYSDLTTEDVLGDGPPSRRTDVQGVVWYHEPPYREWAYGRSAEAGETIDWPTDPSTKLEPGDELPDATWEALFERMRTDPCPR